MCMQTFQAQASAITNGQSRDTGNTEHEQRQTKQAKESKQTNK